MPDQIITHEWNPAPRRIFYGSGFAADIGFIMPNSADIFDISWEDFAEQVLSASAQRPIMVDLWAEWCPPCLAIAPVLDKVIEEYAGAVALAKVEVDEGENMKLAGQYQVRGFPTILLFQHGELKGRFSSAQTVQFVCDFIERHVEF